jgi:hypothetical protein
MITQRYFERDDGRRLILFRIAVCDVAVLDILMSEDELRDFVSRQPETHFAIWCSDGVSVEENDRAVRISQYDPASGIVSNPRIVLPDGSVTEDSP